MVPPAEPSRRSDSDRVRGVAAPASHGSGVSLLSDDPFAYRKLNQRRTGFEVELAHEAVFVKGDSTHGDVQDGGGLLHRASSGEELQDLALAQCELMLVGATGRSQCRQRRRDHW